MRARSTDRAAAYVAILTALVMQTGCAPAWIQAGMNQTAPNGQQRLTYDHWMILTIGYDQRIKAEAAGGRPDAGAANWTEAWDRSFRAIVEGRIGNAYVWERPDLYMNYIVAHRRAAGLPDLPDKLIRLIPQPPANAPPLPSWMTHPPRMITYSCGHPGELSCADAAKNR
jgi:hypothetical protein